MTNFYGKKANVWLLDEFQSLKAQNSLLAWYCDAKHLHGCKSNANISLPVRALSPFFTVNSEAGGDVCAKLMSPEEFFEFISLGSCDIFAYALSTLCYEVLHGSKAKLFYDQQEIVKCSMITTVPKNVPKYETQYKCFASNVKRSTTDFKHSTFCCDEFGGKVHVLCAFKLLTSNETFTVDLTGFQYGIQETYSHFPCFVCPAESIGRFFDIQTLRKDVMAMSYWHSIPEDELTKNPKQRSFLVTKLLCDALDKKLANIYY